jgi:hypothetical protein
MSNRKITLLAILLLLTAGTAMALPATWTPKPIFGLDGEVHFDVRGERDRPDPQGRLGIEEKPAGSKGLIQALWRSALLPGWGQHYLGAPTRGWIFLGSEAGVWGVWGTFMIQEKLRMDDSIEMAEIFSGVSGDHDDSYYKIVGQHQNWRDYNEWLRWEARREYDFGTDDYYSWIAANEIAAGDSWEWMNEDRRITYVLKRKASKTAEQRARNTLFALIVTRVGAMVDTWRVSRTREDIQRIREDEVGGMPKTGLGDLRLSGSVEPRGEELLLRVAWTGNF